MVAGMRDANTRSARGLAGLGGTGEAGELPGAITLAALYGPVAADRVAR
jgi:hypothetical protein